MNTTEGLDAATSTTNGNGKPQMCINDYNYEDGRLRASIRWLITRIYNDLDQLPDTLRQPFNKNSQNRLELTASVIACLTNGSFYCQAASRIFRDNSILTNTIGSVFHAFSQAGIDVRDAGGACITESMLASQTPFNQNAHLILIDALMTAHLRSIVSTEKVVQAISNYTPIEKREEPLDCVDALLFWINKICLLVRDHVERHGIPLNNGGGESNLETIIPEMEDLYEDLCDGACICTLISFYRPTDISLQEICFKDAMSVNDCKFNLEILKKFCSTCLPWNPFHFEIDDILFLHESLQPNVNAYLADIFQFFEGHHSTAPTEPEPVPANQPVQRRFVQIQPISDLRASSHQQQKQMTACGIGGGGKFANARLILPPNNQQRDRAFSSTSTETALTSTTLKSLDSLSIQSPRLSKLNPEIPVTHFGAAPTNSQQQQNVTMEMEGNQNQQQSPQLQSKNMAQIRLQLDGMRRELARRQQMETVKQAEKRDEASKDAFFRVISRNNANGPQKTSLNEPAHQQTPHIQQIGTTQQHLQSTPLNDLLAQQHYSASQHANLSPIGPPPSNSILYSSVENDSALQQQTPNIYGDHRNYAVESLPRMPSGHHYFGHQNTPIPNGAPPTFHHQLAMAHQKPLPPQPSFNQQPPNVDAAQNVYSTAQYGNYGGSNGPSQQQFAQQQPSSTTYFGAGFNSNHQQNNPKISGGGAGPAIQLQPSYSQPSHLHLLHQQQPPQQQILTMPSTQQFQQQPSLIYNTPNGGQQFVGVQSPYQQPQQFSAHFPTHQSIAPEMQQQQHPMYGSSATMFQSTETLVIPPHQSQLMQQQHNFGGGQQTIFEQQQTQQPTSVASSFRLHQSNAPASRLDPQLELNKDLTNWGMTYRAGDRPQRKTWAQKQAEQQQQQNSMAPNGGVGQNLLYSTLSDTKTNAGIQQANPTTNSTPERLPHLGIVGAARNSVEDDGGQFGGNDASMSARASGGMLLEDATEPNNSEMTPEMQAKRRTLLANQIRREQKRIAAQSEEKEVGSATLERRQSEMAKMELAEQRKQERELRRQKLLEDYKRKKMEQELGDPGAASSSSATAAGTGRMYTSSTISLNRGHSQPPFRRPKSQTNLHIHSARSTLQRPDRTQSNMMSASINGEENLAASESPRVPVPSSLGEPQLKLFAKVQPKSNRALIMNALQYSVFPGHVSSESRQKAQAAIATSDSKHFLVLFRDHRLQYRGLYTWDQFSDTIHRIEGTGPKVCKESMMTLMYKYDSGAKSFGKIPTKHLSATIDGFVIDDQYWQKPKIPHSGR